VSHDRPFDGALASYVAATEPPDEVIERVRARAGEAVGIAGSIRHDVPAPADAAEAAQARVLAQVAASRRALETPWRPSFVGGARPRNPWQAPAFAAAGLACLAIAVLWTQRADDPTVVDDEGPALVQAPTAPEVLPETELAATGDAQVVTPIPGLQLALQGQGVLSGTHEAPVVAWRRGRIDVEVEPKLGIGLVVQTDEGDIRVVGTGFSVDRDLLGTHVEVRHGRVVVICRGAAERSLAAGDATTCLPVTAAGLLGRARLLGGTGASADQVLQSVRAGLAASERTDGIWGELVYLQMTTLANAGRHDEARAAAARYVDSGQLPRRDEALRLVDGGRR